MGVCSFPAAADLVLTDEDIAADTVLVTPEQQYADLRRALASDLNRETATERRKLSREEREALHRDLRDAIRNVNADHDTGVRGRR